MLQLSSNLGCMPPVRQREGGAQRTGAGNYAHFVCWELHKCPMLDVRQDVEAFLVCVYGGG